MKTAVSLATLAAATLALAPSAHAQKAEDKPSDLVGVPVPAEASDAPVVHYPPPLVRLKLIAFGLLITGGAWGASFGSATNWPTVPGSAQLKIPIVGPWIALGKSGCASDDPQCSGGTIAVRGALYVLDGIAQLAGLGLIAEAIVMKTESAPEKKTSLLPTFRYRGVEVSAVPVTSPTMRGLGFVGTF
ncbi:MAG: hypothetical protein QM820_56630 [Minicystis sp.]